MITAIFTQLWNYNHGLISNFHHPKTTTTTKTCAHQQLLPFLPPALGNTNLLSVFLDLPFLDVIYKWTHSNVVFCVGVPQSAEKSFECSSYCSMGQHFIPFILPNRIQLYEHTTFYSSTAYLIDIDCFRFWWLWMMLLWTFAYDPCDNMFSLSELCTWEWYIWYHWSYNKFVFKFFRYCLIIFQSGRTISHHQCTKFPVSNFSTSLQYLLLPIF